MKQEPVAWIHNFIEGGISIGKRPSDLDRHPDRWTALYKDPKPCPTCEALCRTVMLDQTSHDTPPQRTWIGLGEDYRAMYLKVRDELAELQQRTWVGLTDEEIKPCWYEACQADLELTSQLVVYFARAIEAKLKEKNT